MFEKVKQIVKFLYTNRVLILSIIAGIIQLTPTKKDDEIKEKIETKVAELKVKIDALVK